MAAALVPNYYKQVKTIFNAARRMCCVQKNWHTSCWCANFFKTFSTCTQFAFAHYLISTFLTPIINLTVAPSRH